MSFFVRVFGGRFTHRGLKIKNVPEEEEEEEGGGGFFFLPGPGLEVTP